MKNKPSKWIELKEFDSSFEKKIIAGTDEAGRGPIAGPVVSAAVILDYNISFVELDDSKKLTSRKRNRLFRLIAENAVDWSVAFSHNHEIDEVNILNASLLSMKKACYGLNSVPDLVLVDGNREIKEFEMNQMTVVKGDSKSASIAAASIFAKVVRDMVMEVYHSLYPQYNFRSHKGYPTAEHLDLLKKLGPCPIHRFSYAPLRKMTQLTLF